SDDCDSSCHRHRHAPHDRSASRATSAGSLAPIISDRLGDTIAIKIVAARTVLQGSHNRASFLRQKRRKLMLPLVEPCSAAVAPRIHGLIPRLVVEAVTQVEDWIDARQRFIEIGHEVGRQKVTKGLLREETERRTITARSLIEKLGGQR